MDYRENGETEPAIAILRRTIESYDKETIGRENAGLGKQLLCETFATYVGDIAGYKEAILYAKKSIKEVLQSGSAKGISDELFEVAWNEKERKQLKPEIYQKKYLQALKMAILFQEREFVIFLKGERKEYIID